MSAQPPGSAGGPASRPMANGNSNDGVSVPSYHRGGDAQIGGGNGNSGPTGTMSQQNLNSIVRLRSLTLNRSACCHP